MRIAQIMLARAFGGAERSFVDLSLALAARGHDVLAIGDSRGVALSKLTQEPRIEQFALQCHGNFDRLAQWRMQRRLRAFHAEIAHTHLARAALLGGRAAGGAGIPSVAKTHNLVQKKYYAAIDRIVTTTQAQHAHMRAQAVAESRLAVIPNFSAFSAIETVAARRRDGAAPVLRAAGRLVRKKGFDLLLEAFAESTGTFADMTLEIAGDGPERDALDAQCEVLGIAGQVRLCGWVDDVAAFLRGADLFVLPSRDEPFGIAVLEAMASGVPIVATRTQGPCEILDPDHAYLCEPGDAAELASCLQVALADESRWQRAERALTRFKTRYAVDPVVAQYEALYTELLAD